MKKALIVALFFSLLTSPLPVLGQLRYTPPYPIWEQMAAVQSGNSPQMIRPQGGEVFSVGQVVYLQWATNGCDTFWGPCTYDIFLVPAGCYDVAYCNVEPILIGRNLATDNGTWRAGSLFNGGYVQGVYRMAVCASGSNILCGVTNSPFTINSSSSGGGGNQGGNNSTITYIYPASGSNVPISDQIFNWNSVQGANEYWVQFGRNQGGNDIYSNSTGLNNSIHLYHFPANLSLMYLRLWWRVGNTWSYRDFSYYLNSGYNNPNNNPNPYPNPYPSQGITTVYPVTGSILPQSPTFVWNSVPGATSYRIQLGSNAGGNDIYDYSTGSALFATINNLPTDGRTIYARISYFLYGQWYYSDLTYRAPLINAVPLTVSLQTSLPTGQAIYAPASVPLEAIVPSGVGVASVDFYQDGSYLGRDTSQPFTFTATGVSTGSHNFTAKATGVNGTQVTSSPLNIYVSSFSVPLLQVNPQGMYFSSSQIVLFTVQNNGNIGRVIFYRNGQVFDEDNTSPFQTAISGWNSGNYSVYANIYDSNGAYIGQSNTISIMVY